MGRYVMRAICYSYGDLGPGEHRHIGYLTSNGGTSRERNAACVYFSEADAWDHTKTADIIGADENGPWCWVEEIK